MLMDDVKQRIEAAIADAEIRLSGEGCSLEARVVSPAFAGLGTLQRHRLVMAAVKDLIASGELHALSIAAHTPQEWAAKGE